MGRTPGSAVWPLVLSLHHVHPTQSSRFVLSLPRLGSLLEHMLEDGHAPVSLEEAVATGPFGDGSARPKTFTLTFDDALLSFRELVFPALGRLGLLGASAAFVPTAYVGGRNEWLTPPGLLARALGRIDVPERLMSWEQLEEISRAGVSVQSHGHAHLHLDELSYDEARADVRTSLALLAEHGIRARYLALPFGASSRSAERAARDARVDAAFTVKTGGRNRFEIRRVPMYGTDSAPMTRLKLSGRFFDLFGPAAGLASSLTRR